MPADANIALQKKGLRDAAIAAREAIPPARRATLDRHIGAHLDRLLDASGPRVLGFCWPHRSEPDLRDWVAAWLDQAPHRIAVLPVVVARAAPMIFRRWTPETPLVSDRFGIPHPPDGEAWLPEALLVPVNAFDRGGFRIGYGGGYFDRTLASLSPRPLAIGIGYECGRVANALPQAHDLPMDWMVTEQGAYPSPAA